MERVDFGRCRIVGDDGSRYDATVRGRVRDARKALGNAVVVGDRVRLAWDAGRAVIEAVAPRRSAFSRRASGARDEEQVVAANLDQVVVVASLRQPEFRPGLVDRVLVQSARSALPALLVLNKTDLGAADEAAALLAEYAHAGIAGLATCALSGRGVEALREACRGRRTLFVGHSGVGKSTLLGVLAPADAPAAAEVNPVTGRGRHTTTAARLLRPAPDLELVDTPGVRAFALWGVDAGGLVEYYPELRPFLGHCRFADCRHDREPGCALHAAAERGAIGPRRFASYLKLRDELEGGFH